MCSARAPLDGHLRKITKQREMKRPLLYDSLEFSVYDSKYTTPESFTRGQSSDEGNITAQPLASEDKAVRSTADGRTEMNDGEFSHFIALQHFRLSHCGINIKTDFTFNPCKLYRDDGNVKRHESKKRAKKE